MTIDKQKLKELALAAPKGPWFGPEYAQGTSYVFDCDLGSLLQYDSIESEQDGCLRYVAAANPATVLALLAEIEQLQGFVLRRREKEVEYDEALCKVADQRDQLKAENESLRKQVADDERKLDALLAHCDDGECPTCAQIICPHRGVMHFHHDGCPSCAEHEAAVDREVSECPKSLS